MTDRLRAEDLDPDPVVQFGIWLEEARSAGVPEPEAMTLATATDDAVPSARMVLLRGVDERGFRFFTNLASRKALELAANPSAALVFHWQPLGRQVRVAGRVEELSRAESEEYFRTRPRGSQLGAWASAQSEVVGSPAELDRRFAESEARFELGDVPLPDNWGGYIVVPDEIEFWHHRPNRMHDRLLYRRLDHGWSVQRLMP